MALSEALSAVYRAPEWSKGQAIVWDLRGVTEWSIDWNDIQGFVQLDKELEPLSGDGLDLVLTGRDLDHLNVVNYAKLSKGNPREVIPCRSVHEVAQRLGVTVAELAAILDPMRKE